MDVIIRGAAALFWATIFRITEGRKMNTITIRKAKLTDLDRMMEIYARAKRFMDSTGNTTQWEIGYPTRKMIQDDIENGYSFVCMGEDNIVHAAFKLFCGRRSNVSRDRAGQMEK